MRADLEMLSRAWRDALRLVASRNEMLPSIVTIKNVSRTTSDYIMRIIMNIAMYRNAITGSLVKKV